MLKYTLFSVAIALLAGCISSGPKTQYYSLFATVQGEAVGKYSLAQQAHTFGIGPVLLPEYLDNPSVISLDSTHQLRVSGYNAWAGDLESSIARVLSTDLARLWDIDGVWAFPWDSRARPDYQVRLVLGKFDGARGGEVQLMARWQVFDQLEREQVYVGNASFKSVSNDESVDAYVSVLNSLLGQLAEAIAASVQDL